MIKLAVVLFSGIAIYVLFYAARFLLLKSGRIRWKKAPMILISIEILVWTVYFFWSIERIFRTKTYYAYLFGGLLVVGFILLAWFYLKEVVAGAFFKLQHNPKTGRYLHVDQTHGTIRRISTTHITLDTADGEVIKIPFSKLITNVFSLSVQKEQPRDFRFKLRTGNRLDKAEASKIVRRALILSPYCLYKDTIEIKVSDEDSSGYTMNISVRPISRAFEGRIENLLKKMLQ